MKLPNGERAYVAQEKITHFLLRHDHKYGQSRARFFSRFGFHVDRWQELADTLLHQGTRYEITDAMEIDIGVKYVVDGEIETPDGRNPLVRTVWMVDTGSNAPRLITAYPIRK